ncbi:lactoylglutathione lyase [Pullulanibacillus camelliae]|uniref:Lactoylglutathione lyase n=1 Tax=Pullulanibacillus camelliae TaxID=1707096 RepID=A0A8J2VLZ6_9BACL|nr:VOC family protein [Pullulanibacillus camelliae]GGE27961.1 lactoylglutathione lyase [Pullulanibacillus camelliae]
MIQKVEHVALIVTDMEKSIAYYSSMFGFSLRTRRQNKHRELAFLKHDQQPGFEIELIRDLVPQAGYSDKGIVNHLAFTVENIEEAIRFYKKRGLTFNSETYDTANDGTKTIFFYGPNQELLQFVERGEEGE